MAALAVAGPGRHAARLVTASGDFRSASPFDRSALDGNGQKENQMDAG